MRSTQWRYRRIRRKYIEAKRAFKQKSKIPFYPFLAIRFIIEQLRRGYSLPTLDRQLFRTESILERWMYYDLREIYPGEIITQYPLGPYWIDLAIPKYKLAIELDGKKYHKNRKAQEHDRRRDAYMQRLGWKVMRFTYEDITKRREESLEKIFAFTQRQAAKAKKKHRI